MLHSREKERAPDIHDIEEFHKENAEQKKSDLKEYTLINPFT